MYKDTLEKANEKNVTGYQPTDNELANQKIVRRDYQIGHEILNREFRELDFRTILEVTDIEHDHFNMIKRPEHADPRQRWRSRDIKPLARQQLIQIAAQMTAQIMVPQIFAQNEDDQRDKDAEAIMRDIFQWNIENSDYEDRMIDSVFSFLVNRACVVSVEYAKIMQTVYQELEDGKLEKKEAVDRLLSGIKLYSLPVNEMLITNAYEPLIQRQRAIIRRRLLGYSEADAIYGKESNWKHIKPGVQVLYDEEQKLFYESEDVAERKHMVEEVTWYCRREDRQICFVNGIQMKEGRIKHRDQKDKDGISRPKYPFAKTFFAPTSNGRLYYGMSAVAELAPQADYVNKMHQIFTDTTVLGSQPPVAVMGGGKFSADVYIPGMAHKMNETAKIEMLGPQANPSFALQAAQEEERILKEALTSGQLAVEGVLPTAYQEAVRREQMLIRLGIMFRQLRLLVDQVGELMVDLTINHQTVAEVMEVVGDNVRLKYPQFVLPKTDDRDNSRVISFDESMIGNQMTEDEITNKQVEMAQEIDADMEIIKVNPDIFGTRRFSLRVTPDSLIPRTQAQVNLDKQQGYVEMMENPFTDKVKVTKDFLLDRWVPGEEDEYMQAQQPLANDIAGAPSAPGAPSDPNQPQGIPSPLDELAGLL